MQGINPKEVYDFVTADLLLEFQVIVQMTCHLIRDYAHLWLESIGFDITVYRRNRIAIVTFQPRKICLVFQPRIGIQSSI